MNPLKPRRPWWLLPMGRVSPWWWIPVAVLTAWSDYMGGIEYFPLLYIIPVILAGWYSGPVPVVVLALTVTIGRLFILQTPGEPGLYSVLTLMTVARGTFAGVVGLWFARLADHERVLETRVEVLEGLLPICAFCKNIRNEKGEWERLEGYISQRSEAEFSHSICPDCNAKNYPGFMTEASIAAEIQKSATHRH